MFHVPVYYIHEIFQDIICMPPAPIDWDLSLLAEHEDFFFWITDQYRRTEKVNNRLQALPDRIQLLLEDDADGYTTLSPAGWVYYESYKEAIHDLPPVMVSDAALRLYRKLDSTRQKLIDREVHKLRIEPLRKGNSGQISSSDCYIYPRGDCAQRIYYYEKDNRLYLCVIAFHELNYEELNQSGVRKGDYQSFEYWK